MYNNYVREIQTAMADKVQKRGCVPQGRIEIQVLFAGKKYHLLATQPCTKDRRRTNVSIFVSVNKKT